MPKVICVATFVLLVSVHLVAAATDETVNLPNRVVENKFINNKCEPGMKCVPYHRCEDTDGAGIFQPRSNLAIEVPCDSLQICCENIKADTDITKYSVANKCGFRNNDGLGNYALVRNNETQFGEMPWMMAVMRNFMIGHQKIYVYVSGGSLIHPSIVITTGHNLNSTDARNVIVRGGEWNTQSSDELLKHVEQDVKEIVYHPEFTRQNLQNDIAILFLKNPFKLEPHINTICLPETGYNHDDVKCFATGWGKSEFNQKAAYQTFLKKVQLPIVAREQCQEMLRKTRLGEDFELHDGFMCAGGEKGVDTCTGDGGSPLACPIPNDPDHYYLAGFVVGGIACNAEGVPGLYLDVMKYKPWIMQEAAQKQFEL